MHVGRASTHSHREPRRRRHQRQAANQSESCPWNSQTGDNHLSNSFSSSPSLSLDTLSPNILLHTSPNNRTLNLLHLSTSRQLATPPPPLLNATAFDTEPLKTLHSQIFGFQQRKCQAQKRDPSPRPRRPSRSLSRGSVGAIRMMGAHAALFRARSCR
ncbi:hypothetical protein EJ04DRAFT_556026 [Polyplosphaeria fusca]|uniref:Uncharacterized protein n=1 Tax=Polyplosphaeria fusca TaxID=682080 RepID=A0A9P4QNC5_9PLEO|nr:hypothetical protein EJ04DRAFT_556026 [Polyplosphaeria fusca]